MTYAAFLSLVLVVPGRVLLEVLLFVEDGVAGDAALVVVSHGLALSLAGRC